MNEVEKIQVYEVVSVHGMLLFGENKPEVVPTKPYLQKLEGYIVDESGSTPITVWNEQIQRVMDSHFFHIQNVRVRQFQGQKYLSTTTETKIEEMSLDDTPKLDVKIVQEAKESLSVTIVECKSIRSVEVITFYTCLSCAKRVQSRQDSSMLKCGHCQNYMMIKNCSKTTAARVQVESQDGVNWYTLFTPTLEQIVKKHNNIMATGATTGEVEGIDADKLSEILLLTNDMKLKVVKDSVVGVELS